MSRKLLLLAAALYPRAWRARYADEFAALLEDVDPAFRDALDVLGGALRMQLRSQTIWKIAASMALAGGIAGAVLAYRAPARYESTSALRMSPVGPADATYVAYRLSELQHVILSSTNLSSKIVRLGLYKSERRSLPMTQIVDGLRRRDLHVSAAPDGALSISFAYPDRAAAQNFLNAIVADMIDNNLQVSILTQRFAAPNSPGEQLKLERPATFPHSALARNPVPYLAWGLALGLLAGLFASVLMSRPKWTLAMAAFALGAGVLAAFASYFIPNVWESTATLRLTPSLVDQSLPTAQRFHELEAYVLNDGNLQRIVETLKLYPNARSVQEAVRRMRDRDLTIVAPPTPVPGTVSTFAISFRYPRREEAKLVVSHLISGFVHRNADTERMQSVRRLFQVMDIVDPPSEPQAPVGPNRYAILLAGMAAGLLIGWLKLRRTPPPAAAARSESAVEPGDPQRGSNARGRTYRIRLIRERLGASGA